MNEAWQHIPVILNLLGFAFIGSWLIYILGCFILRPKREQLEDLKAENKRLSSELLHCTASLEFKQTLVEALAEKCLEMEKQLEDNK